MREDRIMEMIRIWEWVDWKDGSGELANPKNNFYLKLAAAVVSEVSKASDADVVS